MKTPLLNKIASIDHRTLLYAIRKAAPASAATGAGLGGLLGALVNQEDRGKGALQGALLTAPIGAMIGTGTLYGALKNTSARRAIQQMIRNIKHRRG